jgi:hypothetical protein
MSSRRHSFGIVALAFAALGCSLPSIAAEKAHVLVYSGSTGFRHDSIPAAVEALKSIGAKAGYVVDATEDPEVFTAEKLKAYKAIVFVSTSTDPKKPESSGSWVRNATHCRASSRPARASWPCTPRVTRTITGHGTER